MYFIYLFIYLYTYLFSYLSLDVAVVSWGLLTRGLLLLCFMGTCAHDLIWNRIHCIWSLLLPVSLKEEE